MPIAVDAVIRAYWDFYMLRYLDVATATILAYDYCLTLSQELSFIWTSHWSVIHFLYMISRYLPFIDTSFILYHLFARGLNKHECLVSYKIDAFMFVVGIAITEIILMIRIWVVWDRDRRLAICMPACYAVIWTGIVVSTCYFIRSLTFLPSPSSLGCFSRSNTWLLLVNWILFMSFEIAMLILMLIKTLRSYNFSQNVPLLRVVYRDGILFYIFIVGISASNVIIILTLPEVALLLTPFGRVMHSVLTARFVLSLRQELYKRDISEGGHPGYLSTHLLSMPSSAFAETAHI